MMRKPTDDIANWRSQQENTSKPLPYVFPFPAMLCLCEGSISDTMGMLCRFWCLQYGAVDSRGYLGQEHENERHDREQTVFGVFHCGGCYITSDFFCGCSVWIYPETFLAVSLLRASISLLCSDTKE